MQWINQNLNKQTNKLSECESEIPPVPGCISWFSWSLTMVYGLMVNCSHACSLSISFSSISLFSGISPARKATPLVSVEVLLRVEPPQFRWYTSGSLSGYSSGYSSARCSDWDCVWILSSCEISKFELNRRAVYRPNLHLISRDALYCICAPLDGQMGNENWIWGGGQKIEGYGIPMPRIPTATMFTPRKITTGNILSCR